MRRNDEQLGTPGILYRDTKTNIEALSGIAEGAIAYATDTNQDGTYDGAAWTWKAGVNAANIFTAAQKINVNSTTALLVEQDGVKDNVLVVDTTNGQVALNNGTAARPALIGASTDTGIIFNPSGNTQRLGFVTAGVLRLEINQTGAFNFGGSSLLTLGDYGSPNNNTRLVFDSGLTGRIAFRTPTYNPIASFQDDGSFLIGNTFTRLTNGGKLQVVGDADKIQVIVKANATQTTNLTEWQNSSGTALLKVQPDGDLEFVANNIVTDATTGTKIGTATTQKLGFFNATPIVQPSAYTQTYSTADKTHAAFTSADIGAFTGGTVGFLDAAERDNIRTQFNALRADLADAKQLINSLIDDLQALGLVG